MISKNGKTYFTPEEENAAKENNNALTYAMSQGYDLIKKGSYYVMREHDSLIFSPDGKYHWNSVGIINGNAISFIMNYENRSYKDAVLTLSGNQFISPVINTPAKVLTEHKELVVPGHAANNKIMFAYLVKTRGIDPSLISKLTSEKKLYQDALHNNVVMVGLDENEKPRYISQRSTNTYGQAYKLDATGSDKSYPFVIDGTPSSNTVYVCESPIEAMSLWTLFKITNSPYIETNIISLGGTSDNSLNRFLNEHKEVTNIVIATNNDKDKTTVDLKGNIHITNAGKKSRERITEKYSATHKVTSLVPHKNDWSDELVSLRKNPMFKIPEPQNRKEKNIQHDER